ncbi:MAG: sulfatase, partial [Myxococcales bacterium]|nr:sulfatase [Myxococcales bacterium]
PPAPRAPAVEPSRVRTPDVVIVMVDTLRADHLSLYGYQKPTSPELAAFAGVATDYVRAYAQSSWTAPSVTSMITSRYPREVGVRRDAERLPGHTRTLAAVLREHGYRTEGVSTNLFITRKYGHHVGFDRLLEVKPSQGAVPTSHLVTDLGLLAAREAPPTRPLFMYLHYFDPHYDYVMHSGFRFGWFEPETGPDASRFSFFDARMSADLDERDMARARAHYDSEIGFTDYHVGRLLSGLRALARFDNAVIVVVADHGEEFLEHGAFGHAVTLYDELVHVPLLIKAPFQNRGQRHQQPVALLDVAPTILDLAGLPPEPGHRGVSLRSPGPPRPIFLSTFRPTHKVALVRNRFKAVLDRDDYNFDVFDLVADPYEQHSIARERPVMAALMRFELERWDEGTFDGLQTVPVDLSGLQKQRLRVLGYAQ